MNLNTIKTSLKRVSCSLLNPSLMPVGANLGLIKFKQILHLAILGKKRKKSFQTRSLFNPILKLKRTSDLILVLLENKPKKIKIISLRIRLVLFLSRLGKTGKNLILNLSLINLTLISLNNNLVLFPKILSKVSQLNHRQKNLQKKL